MKYTSIIDRRGQQGSHHIGLVVVAVLALIGLLGFVGYSAWQRQAADAGGESTLGSRSPVNDGNGSGISCKATFGGVKMLQNGHKQMYGKVTVNNSSNTTRKVVVTLRAEGFRGWWGVKNSNTAKGVRIPAHDSFSKAWSSEELANSNKSRTFKVVATLNSHETSQTDTVCKSKGFKLAPPAAPSPHG